MTNKLTRAEQVMQMKKKEQYDEYIEYCKRMSGYDDEENERKRMNRRFVGDDEEPSDCDNDDAEDTRLRQERLAQLKNVAPVNPPLSTQARSAKSSIDAPPTEAAIDYELLDEFKDSGIRWYNWFLTSYADEGITLKCVHKDVIFCVSKREICPTTARPHSHTYVEFRQRKSMRWLKNFFKNPALNCQPRLGTAKQAIEYVVKEATTYPGAKPEFYGEPKKQGNRSDLDAMKEAIVQGGAGIDLLMKFNGNALRHMGMIERAQKVRWGYSAMENAIIGMRLGRPMPDKLIDGIRADDEILAEIEIIIEEAEAIDEEREKVDELNENIREEDDEEKIKGNKKERTQMQALRRIGLEELNEKVGEENRNIEAKAHAARAE